MGLVRQMDAHFGRLLAHLEMTGRIDDTLIAFTSDHGDFLGDHWQGEKEFMYEQSVCVPLIVVDPSPHAKRGARTSALVQGVDLLPTILEALGQRVPDHVIEGRSLLGLVRGGEAWPVEAVFSELDYAIYPTARKLGLGPRDARMVMVRTKDRKLVHFGRDLPPQLFDLENDPDEVVDLGADPAYGSVRRELHDRLFEWMRERRNRTGMSDSAIRNWPGPADAGGVTIGVW
jgi:arylsulfatase A-like enzyme